MQAEHIADAVKLTPVVGFVGTSLAGFQWDVFSYIVASIYTCLMICNFIWTKVIKPIRDRKREG